MISKQNAKGQNSTTKWLTIQHYSWISFSSNICALPHIFDLLSIWGCSCDNMVDDIIFHKLNSLLAHHHPISILEIFTTIQMNGPRPRHDIPISCLDYTTYETVVTWDLTESGRQVWGITDASRQTWVDKVYPSWQRHLSSSITSSD